MLKGLRFRERLRLLPGREDAADPPAPEPGRIGRDRHAPRHRSLWIGAAALAVGLIFAGWQNRDAIANWFAPPPAPFAMAAAPAPPAPASMPEKVGTQAPAHKPRTIAAQRAELLVPGGIIHVRRGGSVLREAKKPSAAALNRLPKGAAVTVVALDGPWTQVRNGDVTGWMRTSVLGPDPGD